VYAELERAGVLETRRGVGSFISASPAQAHPPREHDRRLRAFVTRVLADADASGFTIEDLMSELQTHNGDSAPKPAAGNRLRDRTDSRTRTS
jgi:DNA-binding transcriptional regulator YhcF (GntR family)